MTKNIKHQITCTTLKSDYNGGQQSEKPEEPRKVQEFLKLGQKVRENEPLQFLDILPYFMKQYD